MKIDRLLGLITILLQKEKVTAPYLAERFEVSRRTIHRDVDAICKAGIPVVTVQGVHGGISIADGYKIDKTVFTDQELRIIFAGLCGLESVLEDTTSQVANQPLNQLTNHAMRQVTNHAMRQVTNHAMRQVTNRATSQVTNRATSQVTNQPACQITNRATSQIKNGAINQPACQITNRATNQPLNQITNQSTHQSIIDKFFSSKTEYLNLQKHILIDLSSHYKQSLSPKISRIQKAILEKYKIEFVYHSKNGERRILLDPYLVVFQWSSWYVFGFEDEKQDFRLFKLNRLCALDITDSTFLVQNTDKEKLNFSRYFTDEIQAIILFDNDRKYRLIDEYGENCFVELANGKLQFEFPFTNEDYLLSWVLSFGEKAELIEPKELREKLKIIVQNTFNLYK